MKEIEGDEAGERARWWGGRERGRERSPQKEKEKKENIDLP